MAEQRRASKVFLFSGHMIDQPERKTPRFPPEREPVAARAIAAKLDVLGATAGDLALCGGACGGDLLFAEAALERDLDLELRIPFPVPRFLEESVAFAGDAWVDRFHAAARHERARLRVLPDGFAPTDEDLGPFARNNLWLLDGALAGGAGNLEFICLWDRRGGDGPGGTEHMFRTVQERAGTAHAHVLDTNELW